MHDVIIAGAGPVGLSLALALARAGKSVLVLEKEAQLPEHSRAPAIWPRTQEILAGLGVIDRFLHDGIVLSTFYFFDADAHKVRLELPLHELKGKTPYPHLLILPQDKTERFLYEALLRLPHVQVQFNSEVTGFEDQGGRVRIRCSTKGTASDLEAFYLVGCDGAHSKVREVLGFSLEGFTYDSAAALADIRLQSSEDYAFPRFSRKGVFAVALKMQPRLWRLIFPYPVTDTTPLEERIRVSTAHLFPGALYDLVWQSEFRLHRRVTTSFVRGRIALAGDAAHLNSPIGGQGMNAGIQDAEVLARCLLQALEQDNPALLKPYEAARLPAIRRGVNRFTNQLTRILLFQNGRYLPWVLTVMGLLLRLPFLRKNFLHRVAMLR